jgi:hypothetical protein
MIQAMPLTISPLGLPTRPIEKFRHQFGEPHLLLAYQVALPVALTPDLAYCLWMKFQRDITGISLDIPWIAVSDLLLSSLCREVDQGVYEMEPSVRQELLNALQVEPRLGQQRLLEIAEFLLGYIQPSLQSEDALIRTLAQAQEWTALSYLQPDQAIRKMALSVKQAYQDNPTELLRLVHLIESLTAAFEESTEFDLLLAYARGMASFVRGDAESAKAEFSKLLKRRVRTQIAGELLPIPEPFQPQLSRTILLLSALASLAVGGLVWLLLTRTLPPIATSPTPVSSALPSPLPTTTAIPTQSPISSPVVPPTASPSPAVSSPTSPVPPTASPSPAVSSPTSPNLAPSPIAPLTSSAPTPTSGSSATPFSNPNAPSNSLNSSSSGTPTQNSGSPAVIDESSPIPLPSSSAQEQTSPAGNEPSVTTPVIPAPTQTAPQNESAPTTSGATPTPKPTISLQLPGMCNRRYQITEIRGKGTVLFNDRPVRQGEKLNPPGIISTGSGVLVTLSNITPSESSPKAPVPGDPGWRLDDRSRGPSGLGSITPVTTMPGISIQRFLPSNSQVDICSLR